MHRSAFGVRLLVLLLTCLGSAAAAEEQEKDSTTGESQAMPLALGGCGGVYFLAEPGELIVDVYKRDRNVRGQRTELHAILVAPDRRVLAEGTIPDDGRPRGSGMGPVGHVRLAAKLARSGVYGLNITVSQDRYGDEMVWGFRTNCPRYVIETARGHRDERHQEPIVLFNPGQAAEVCFRPRAGALTLELSGLPRSVTTVPLYDARGALIQQFVPDAKGHAAGTVPPGVHRQAVPWRLHLPEQPATLHIDGLTRWDEDDRDPNQCCWTSDPAADFPWLPNRWLLTPYQRTVYGPAGQTGSVTFRVHNNAQRERTIQLTCEFAESAWPAELSTDHVTLRPQASAEIAVRYTVAADGPPRVCHLRATPADDAAFTTYVTLTVQRGEAPAARPLAMPLVLQPYQHEHEQFGYLPDYPTTNQLYFGPRNRPFAWTDDGIACRGEDAPAAASAARAEGSPAATRWRTAELRSAVVSGDGGTPLRGLRMASTKIAFDRAGDVYALASAGAQAFLLHSADGGRTFAAHPLPRRGDRTGTLDFEQFSGHNRLDGPPPILRYAHTASDPRLFWRRVHDLELLLPRKTAGGLVVGEPVLVTQQCIGLAAHSGIPSSVVSRGTKVHVTWAEATDPQQQVPGVPTYVVSYDRDTHTLGTPVLVGYGAPPNDIHNSPSITIDSRGYLHVLAGTHGKPFQYARSSVPNDAQQGWSAAVPVGADLSQTYIGLVCGADDTLHLVYRLWRFGAAPFPASHQATLAYQRKHPDQPWEPPQILVVPPFSEYSVYYHRLTIDQAGQLFLSYDYWSTHWFYRNDHRGHRRAVLQSPDNGQTWRLAAP